MKKKILCLIVLLFSIVALVACGETITGAQGAKGDTGEAGKSAYELAVENGFQGTVAQWIDSLVGAKGNTGKTGTAGSNGVDGKDAHKITIYEEDGRMYWKRLPNEGEADTFSAQYLYDTKDYITVRYFLTREAEEPIKTEQVKRVDIGSYELLEYKDNDQAIGMGYTHDGWESFDGKEYEEYETLTNHSVDLFLVKHYQGVKINVEYGLDQDGNQISTYEAGAFADYLTSLFLADIATAGVSVTAEGFYAKFNVDQTKINEQFMGMNGDTAVGLCALHPELVTRWGALIRFACQSDDTYRDAALNGHGLAPYGTSWKSFAADEKNNKYINRYLIGAICSFMNHNQQDVDDEYHPEPDYSDASLYVGIGELYADDLATFLLNPENVKSVFEGISNLAVMEVEGAVFYLKDDQTMTPVALQDLVEGQTYCYGVLPQ